MSEKQTSEHTLEGNRDSYFASGVVEGFYGKPWTYEQRKDLFKKLQRWKMNCYLYAPKDDWKHRAYWRELYSEDEAKQLSLLIEESHIQNIDFYYAIAPGLDITYSDPNELSALKQKLEQLQKLGCKAFAILFDDIETELKDEDKKVYNSFAQAQVAVANDVYHHLCQPKFMFCPTDYCTSRTTPNVKESEYLNSIGSSLEPSINILWTGPLVVSKTITCEHIKEVAEVLKRPPVIWENLHANDYDRGRIYLGPFSERSPELPCHLRGFLTNPNCEYGPNFVAIHTLSQWLQCYERNGKEYKALSEASMEGTVSVCTPKPYSPREAFLNALKEWLPEFNLSVDAYGSLKPCQTAEKKAGDAKAQGVGKSDLELTVEDLELLADLFYLPYEHGERALTILNEFKWLKERFDCIIRDSMTEGDKTADSMVQEWHKRADKFGEMAATVKRLGEKIVSMNNRTLLYEIYPYLSSIKGSVGVVNSYVQWIGSAKFLKEAYSSEARQLDLWLKKGGLPAQLLNMLVETMKEFSYLENLSNGDGTLRTHLSSEPSLGNCFLVRPLLKSDHDKLFNLILRTGDDGQDATSLYAEHPQLIGELTIGAFLDCNLKGAKMMVVEDDCERLQGVCLSIPDAKSCYEQQKSFLRLLLEKYPEVTRKGEKPTPSQELLASIRDEPPSPPEAVLASFPSCVLIRVHPDMKPSITRRLLSYALNSLRDLGSSGVHATVKQSEKNLSSMYSQMDFKEHEETGPHRFLTMTL